MRLFFLLGLLVVLSGCSAITGVFGGVTGNGATDTNDSCDRRLGPQPQAFCQEIVSTIAGTPFQQDCLTKFEAGPAPGLCSREGIVGGCEYNQVFQDGSRVTDWFYDMVALDGDAGDSGLDNFPPGDRHLTVTDVEKKCADPSRYSDAGASFVLP